MTELARRDPQQTAMQRVSSASLPQYLTRDQVHALLEACRSERDRLFARAGFETGGRVTELIGIRRSDIDLANRQIRLVTLKRLKKRQRKQREHFRWLPVTHSLIADLASYFLEHPIADGDRIFPFTRQAAFKMLKHAGARAGVVARGGRDVSPHILRHSFAMNCLTQGMPINVLQELLGHSSILNTMIYLKTDPAEARAFLAKVNF